MSVPMVDEWSYMTSLLVFKLFKFLAVKTVGEEVLGIFGVGLSSIWAGS